MNAVTGNGNRRGLKGNLGSLSRSRSMRHSLMRCLLQLVQVAKRVVSETKSSFQALLSQRERPRAIPFQRVYRFEVLEPRRLLAVMTEVPLVGGVSDEIAKIMVRTDESASVAVEYSMNPSLAGSSITAANVTVAGSDFTTIFDLDNLQSLQKYYYRVLVDGVSQQTGLFPSFTTFPAPNTQADFTFAVASDSAEVNERPDLAAPAFASIAADSASFLLQIGDFDHRDPSNLEEYRIMNRELRDPATLAGADFAENIAAQMPFFKVWDDHDYGRNDSDKTLFTKEEALQTFKEYYPTPELANPENGIWYNFQYAQAEFFMLDTRSQRDPKRDVDDANKSMLDGDNIADGQLDWLKEELLNSTAEWKFLISTVTFNLESREGSADLWRSYSTEANDISNFIETNDIQGVIVLSGDLHTGGGIDDGTNSLIGLPEITVSHTNLTGGNSRRMGAWSEGVTQGRDGGGYALIRVNGTTNEVTIEAKAADGSLRHSMTLSTAAPSPDPDIGVTPLALDFGSLPVGQTVQDIVTISNTGSQILSISSLATTNSVFTVIGPSTPIDIAPGDSQDVTLEFEATVAGTALGELQIVSDDPDEGLVSVALSGNGVVAGEGLEFYLNAGGADYTSLAGIEFVADKEFVSGDFGYTEGRSRSIGAAVSGTDDDLLYQSVRTSRTNPFSYTFDAISNGDYEVTLYFIEPVPSTVVGARVFDVLAEGTVRLDDFDVVSVAGAVRAAHNETFVVTVSDGQLNLDFVPVNSTFAFVSAISVVEVPIAAAARIAEVTSGFDFLAWQRGFGMTTGAVRADGNRDGDGDVDASDLADWEAAFGQVVVVAEVGSGGSVAASSAASSATVALQAAPLASTAELLDAAIAWELANENIEEEPLGEDQPISAEAATDATFALDDFLPTAATSGQPDLPATSLDESEEADAAWLSDELLERVFG